MTISYEWSDTPRAFKNASKADPETIGLALDRIANAHNGRLEPKHIVDAAENRRHPLHPFFEWNDAKAAAMHRLDTARRLTRSIVLVDTDKPEATPVRPWISVQDSGVAYRSHEAVLSEVALQLAVLKRAYADLVGWMERYKNLDKICGGPMLAARTALSARIMEMEGGRHSA